MALTGGFDSAQVGRGKSEEEAKAEVLQGKEETFGRARGVDLLEPGANLRGSPEICGYFWVLVH